MPTRFRLREWLEQLGVSQYELERRSGVSYVTINGMANNKTTRVDLATLDKLATALGIEPGELIVQEPSHRKGARR